MGRGSKQEHAWSRSLLGVAAGCVGRCQLLPDWPEKVVTITLACFSHRLECKLKWLPPDPGEL